MEDRFTITIIITKMTTLRIDMLSSRRKRKMSACIDQHSKLNVEAATTTTTIIQQRREEDLKMKEKNLKLLNTKSILTITIIGSRRLDEQDKVEEKVSFYVI